MGDAAANLEAAMLNSLRSMRQNATGSFVDDVMGFYHAIDWSERWLLALLCFHLCVWLVVVGTRRHNCRARARAPSTYSVWRAP